MNRVNEFWVSAWINRFNILSITTENHLHLFLSTVCAILLALARCAICKIIIKIIYDLWNVYVESLWMHVDFTWLQCRVYDWLSGRSECTAAPGGYKSDALGPQTLDIASPLTYKETDRIQKGMSKCGKMTCWDGKQRHYGHPNKKANIWSIDGWNRH